MSIDLFIEFRNFPPAAVYVYVCMCFSQHWCFASTELLGSWFILF